MPRFSAQQTKVISDLRKISTRALTPARLGHALISALECAIGWDGYRLFGVDTRTLLINRLLSASDNDRTARYEWLAEVYLDDRTLPYLQLPEIVRSRLRGVAYQPTQEQSWGYPREMLATIDPAHHQTYYFESQSPAGGTLHATLEANGRQIAVLQAYRRDPKAHFRPKDVVLMQAATPVIGQALGAALTRERALSTQDAQDASGFMLVGPDRTIHFSTPAGDAWLADLQAIEPESNSPLPIAVWSAIKGFDRQREAALRLALITQKGPVVVEASAGGDGSTAIVVTPHRAESRAELPDRWELTPQQSQVAMLVIGGLSNREIAGRLFVSEHTVEWHLRQIFRTLDLSSRTQLQARYFRDCGLIDYQDFQAD